MPVVDTVNWVTVLWGQVNRPQALAKCSATLEVCCVSLGKGLMLSPLTYRKGKSGKLAASAQAALHIMWDE